MFYKKLLLPSTNTLRPIIPNNACSLRLTATAGTKLVGASSLVNVIIFTSKRTLQPNSHTQMCIKILFCLLRSLNITGSSFRPLSKIPHCWLEPGPFSVPVWLIIFSNQLRIIDLVSHYHHQQS